VVGDIVAAETNAEGSGEAVVESKLAELDRDLEQFSVDGYWRMAGPRTYEPRSQLQPMLWQWSMLRERLLRAGELVSVSDAGRRTLRLLNPGLFPQKSTTQTLQMALQLVLPGEVAAAHRHTMAAIRFVVEGSGAFTTVEGDSFLMEPGDLILTPNWTFHDHINESEGPVIWIDGLDGPFARVLDVAFQENYEQPQQSVNRVVRTVTGDSSGWYYKWRDTERTLHELAQQDDVEEVVLQYRGKDGGPTLPTIACGVQLLRPGEGTRFRRRTSSVIHHVIRGQGRATFDDVELQWEKGDCFLAPNWRWHRLENSSAEDEALLFFMSDRAILEPFGLYREQYRE
jgi:gentisate 1,2-dioxygenase